MEENISNYKSQILHKDFRNVLIDPEVNFEVEDCNCANPVLIVNPQLRTVICQADKYSVDSLDFSITPQQRHFIFTGDNPCRVLGLPFAHVPDRSKFSDKDWPSVERRFRDFLCSSYFFNSQTGECWPLYVFVPCGKCDVCQSKKFYGIVQRCLMAYEESKRPMLFVTLTYNDGHLPDKPSIRDVQLFKKRLKRQTDVLYFQMCPQDDDHLLVDPPSSRLKFLCVSERGNLGRIHYHLAIFGMPGFTNSYASNKYYTVKLLQYCWRDAERLSGIKFRSLQDYIKHFPLAFDVPPDYDSFSRGYVNLQSSDDNPDFSGNEDAAVGYMLKYINKNQFSDDSSADFCDDDFLSISTNLGLDFVRSRVNDLLSDRNRDGMFMYTSFAGGKVRQIHLCGYYLKKLFPSLSTLVPCEFRRDFSSMIAMSDELLNSGNFSKSQQKVILGTRMYFQKRFDFWEVLDSYSEARTILKAPIPKYVGVEKTQLLLDFGTVCERLTHYDIDYDVVLHRIKDRMLYFSKLKSRSVSHRNLSGRDHSKQLKVLQSKSSLP